jgi:hypothetical protein
VLRAFDGRDVEGARLVSGRGRRLGTAAAKRVLLPKTGRYFFVLASDSGDATALLGNLAVRPPRGGQAPVEDFGAGDGIDVEFGALAGAKLTFTAIGNRRGGVEARITSLTAPDGTTTFRPDLDPRSRGVRETIRGRELDQSGTWRVRIVGSGGTPSTVRYTYRLRQPRGATFSAD